MLRRACPRLSLLPRLTCTRFTPASTSRYAINSDQPKLLRPYRSCVSSSASRHIERVLRISALASREIARTVDAGRTVRLPPIAPTRGAVRRSFPSRCSRPSKRFEFMPAATSNSGAWNTVGRSDVGVLLRQLIEGVLRIGPAAERIAVVRGLDEERVAMPSHMPP